MQVVSGLKTWPLVVWPALFGFFGAYMLYEDAHGRGLHQTMFYPLLGVAIYPVFYGAVAFLLVKLASMLWHRADYLRVDGHSLAMGGKVMPFTSVRDVVLRTNYLGLTRVAIVCDEGRKAEVMGYMLSQPTGPTIATLREALREGRN